MTQEMWLISTWSIVNPHQCWLISVCHVTAGVWNRQRSRRSERLSGQHGEENSLDRLLPAGLVTTGFSNCCLTFFFQDSNFLSATGLLTGSVKRFSTMVRSGRDNRRILCYVSVGLVVLFFLLYYLIARIQQWLQLFTSAAQEEIFILLNKRKSTDFVWGNGERKSF